MKKSLFASFVIGLVMAIGSIAFAASAPGSGIAGTLHDLSATGAGGIAVGEGTETRICVFCHTPHFAAKGTDFVGVNSNVKYFPLWNHDMSTASYATYTSGSDFPNATSNQLNAVLGQPGGVSKLCLSCHDGSVAINSYGNFNGNPTHNTGTKMMGSILYGVVMGGAMIGAGADGLSNHHPVGFNYNDVALKDNEIWNSSHPLNGGTGLTISDVLWASQVECVSCHSVHNKKNEGLKFLWVNDDNGSALCLSCHDK